MLNFFEVILYINLKHRTDRNNYILHELNRVGVDKKKITRIEGTYTPFNGHLGCVISHIAALDFAIENNLKNILILEDDCYFIKDVNFLNFSIEYFMRLVDKWDVFLLGGYYEKKEVSQYPYIDRIKKSLRAHAYAVNRKYFQPLKDNFLETKKNLEEYQLFFKANLHPLDVRWQPLQEKDLWYANELLLSGQKEDFSDITWINRPKR